MKNTPTNISSYLRKEFMSLNTLLSDLSGCSVEQVSRTEEAIVITASATTSSACFPDCQHVSSRVHSISTRSPRALLRVDNLFVLCSRYAGSAAPTRSVNEKHVPNPFPS
jgi:hypothetical protein